MIKLSELRNLEESTCDILVEKVTSGEIVSFMHPKLDVETFPRASQRSGMANIIHLSDIDLDNHWYIIQVTSMVDGFLFSGDVNSYSVDGVVKTVSEKIINGSIVFDLKNSNNLIDGFILSQTRPYHYLYDQFVNYFRLSDSYEIKDRFFKMTPCFYDEAIGVNFNECKGNGCYISPCFVTGDYFSKHAEKMHDFLRSNSDEKHLSTELTVWFGISGQKRSWIEQVDSCIELCKQLISEYSSLSILIDGWTAGAGKVTHNYEDQELFEKIRLGLQDYTAIQVINMVGLDYKEKIGFCNEVDYFVANSGSGSVVPHAICRKKGVIHGRLSTFKELYCDDVLKVPIDKVVFQQSGIPMNDSYSFHWSVVYNLLVELGVKGRKIPEIEVDTDLPGNTFFTSKDIFSKLSVKTNQPADILREVALKFEENNEIELALSIMDKARQQRPKGGLINKKIAEYKSRLGK